MLVDHFLMQVSKPTYYSDHLSHCSVENIILHPQWMCLNRRYAFLKSSINRFGWHVEIKHKHHWRQTPISHLRNTTSRAIHFFENALPINPLESKNGKESHLNLKVSCININSNESNINHFFGLTGTNRHRWFKTPTLRLR